MDRLWLYAYVLPSILALLFLARIKLGSRAKSRGNNLPPSPPSRPVIGHLHLIKQPLHCAFQELSYKYGAIYFLKLGFSRVVVISSPKLVEECFTKNDVVLANRPQRRSGKHFNYDWTTLAAVSYGPLWRDLRRITTLEFFSNTRLNLLADVRVGEVKSLVKGLFERGKDEFVKVEMKSKFSELAFNVVMRMVTGKKYFGAETEGVEEAKVFCGIVRDVFELSAASNPVDFFPFLKWFDFRNMEGKMLAVRKEMDAFLNGLIEECRTNRSEREADAANRKAMIYKLLDFQETDPELYSDQIIKGIIMIMLTAGTDTSAVTIEWALSLLLNNPGVLRKGRDEIGKTVGNDRLVDESDLPKLPWIHNIVSETLRLFPAAPLLVPHESAEDCTIASYHVQKGTTVLINGWAIHRDPNVWDDPLSFRPERFKGAKSEEYKYSLVPFGLGRRSCPGAPLANRVIALTLAALIQCFDWETVDGETVDLAQGSGLTMPKLKPLEAKYRARSSMINVLSDINA